MNMKDHYLSKDTKVFVIYNPKTQRTLEKGSLLQNTIKSFEAYGYKCKLQPYTDGVRNINIRFQNRPDADDTVKFTENDVKKWLTFMNVLIKARILEEHFIVAFEGNYLEDDISKEGYIIRESHNGKINITWNEIQRKIPSSKFSANDDGIYLISPWLAKKKIKQWSRRNPVRIGEKVNVGIETYFPRYADRFNNGKTSIDMVNDWRGTGYDIHRKRYNKKSQA